MDSSENQKPQQQSKPQPQAQPQAQVKPKESDLAKLRGQLELMIKAYAEEKARADDLEAKLKYMQADYENLRRRTDKQIDEMRTFANEELLCSLLETVDELELALKAAKTCTSEAIVQGVEMTLKKLKKLMEHEGVTEISAECKEFDPAKHAAVGRVETNELKDGTVVEEVRKGYMLRDKVIRPSMVRVAVNSIKTSNNGCDSVKEKALEAISGNKNESEAKPESGSNGQNIRGVDSHE